MTEQQVSPFRRGREQPTGFFAGREGELGQAKWREHWWSMPAFEMVDATPARQVIVSFATEDDAQEFARLLSVRVGPRTHDIWYPPQRNEKPGDWCWCGHPGEDGPRFPVFIPSKGRWAERLAIASHRLSWMGVPHYVVVEPQEYRQYERHASSLATVLRMPFGNLGRGSIPARNWIWEMARREGHSHHWVVDDNVLCFYRLTGNRRLPVDSGAIFRAAEDWVLRYTNVALAGFKDIGLMNDRMQDIPAYVLNTRIYSMTLVRTDLPFRWRGRYNEDTDLSLRCLKAGWCTVQFNTFLGDKPQTGGDATGRKASAGGNTDNVYNQGDYRLKFAESLREQHPDVVEVVWKYNRWHHKVDYHPFRRNKLVLAEGVVPTGKDFVCEYGMQLRRKKVQTCSKPEEESAGD